MNKMRVVCMITTLALLAGLALAGCALMRVEVWERDVLAEPSMQLDRSTQDRDMDDHIYFTNEAASGGRGFGGGGCGCN